MKHRSILLALVLVVLAAQVSQAQWYSGAFVGFKSSGLEGALKLTTPDGVASGKVVDAGDTGFNFGLCVGYQILQKPAGGWYRLDLNLDVSYTSLAYFEAGYDDQFGSGKFGADGLSGGSTSIFALDIMPMHRAEFATFKLLSPFAGIGLALNLMSTGDIETGPPSISGTLTGAGEFKIGLLLFYGTLVRISDMFVPYLQFKHMIPFGENTQLTDEFQPSGATASGYAFSIQDVPGYFSITAGVRFYF